MAKSKLGQTLPWLLGWMPLLLLTLGLTAGSALAVAPPYPSPNGATPVQAEGRNAGGQARPDPAARAKAQAIIGGEGILLIPDWINDRVMAFDSQNGNLVDPDFIPSDPDNLASPKEAILSASGNSILVSDQIMDVVQEYDLSGSYIGIFAPSVGVSTTIMNNIRGIELRPNGNLLVTVAEGPNSNAVAEFDTGGDYLGNFIPPNTGGLNGPFDVISRTADYLVTGSLSRSIHRYDATGAFLGLFATVNNSFFQQVAEAANGNVLVASYDGPQGGVFEYTSSGVFVGRYTPVNDPRGVYELGNGNILISTGNSVLETDRKGNIVATEMTGVSPHFISYVVIPAGGSPTATSTYTPIFTNTSTPTRTPTLTHAVTSTPSFTPTPSSTSTNSPTAIITITSSSTPTSGPSFTTTSTRSPTATTCVMSFSDVSETDWFYDFVRYLYCEGAISGYADGTFRPYNNTTRGQICKIVILAFDYPTYTPLEPTFTDVPESDPFYTYIETAAHNNIVAGYSDGAFRPYNNVTRGQLCKITVIAADWPILNPPTPRFSDVPPENPFYPYIETAACHGIITGYSDGTFRWGHSATRAQISKIVCLAVRDEAQCTPPTATPSVTPQPRFLSYSSQINPLQGHTFWEE